MPTAPVDDKGNVLYYEDSGAPRSASETPYTTLILVHGMAFHSPIFRRLLPFASKYNLRLIFMNRRDYPGSSPYTEEDFKNVENTEDEKGFEAFFKDRACEFAKFIEWIVTHHDIPKADWETKSGGVFIMPWSAANGYVLPMLSYADHLPEATLKTIEPYLRGFIVFESPRWLHGLPPPPIQTPDQTFKDQSLTPEERSFLFCKWVGSFYKHASLTSRVFSDLQTVPDPGSRRSTPEAMGKEELANCMDGAAVIRSEFKARVGPLTGYRERVRLAAFDERMAGYLPGCRLLVLWSECSAWTMVETAWEFENLKEAYDKQGVKGRTFGVEMIPGANHFTHWEEPEKTLAFLAKNMSS